jgi:hypothetical protein
MLSYKKYFLSDNPFPSTAIVDVNSQDIRINGTIFYEGIFKSEIEELRKKLEAKTNLIYIAGLKFTRGTGKSALLVNIWRRMQNNESVASVYIRCTESSPNNKPSGFATSIILELHRKGYLWEAFRRLLLMYVQDRPSALLTREAIDTLFRAFPKPVERLPLSHYTYITDPFILAKALSNWSCEKCGAAGKAPLTLFSCYLTEPTSFEEKYPKIKEDKIELYKNILKLLTFADFKWNYFFFDQMEDAIMATPGRRMGEFCLGMRRILEASMNSATIIVTLHPDSEMKLNVPSADHLTRLAPLDVTHRVDIMIPEAISDDIINLVAEYMKRFRIAEPPTHIYPFDPEVIKFIGFKKEGNIREILQQLHECIKYGAEVKRDYIDMNFLIQHPRETVGTLINESELNKFRRRGQSG